jgi:adenylate cyclase
MLESRSVSRLHALVQRKEGGSFSLVDLGSRNGSFVNAQRVSFPVVLNDRDAIVLGDQELLFRNPTLAAPPSVEELSANPRNTPTVALYTQALATVVVVDIRDFTPLARTLPEAVLSQTIGTWFLRSGQIAQRHGSWAQKYAGDAVMAVWLHENRGRTASEMVAALKAVAAIDATTSEISREFSLPGPLRIGAGVNTGPVIVGSADFTALGDTVNTAFRLEAATKDLGFAAAIGERTFQELPVRGTSPFARREVALKGYESPSVAWAISFEHLRGYLGGLE